MAAVLELQEVNEELAAIGLSNPELEFLKVEPGFVKFLLFQPRAIVVAEETRVGVQNQAFLTLQMKQFLHEAFKTEADIVLCPEYSCTWLALTETIEEQRFPAAGKLWVLACESASRQQLSGVIECLERAGHVVAFDQSVWDGAGNFIDPICYLFRTYRENGEPVGVALIQPKTCPMGGIPFEQDFLACGNKIYRFRNSGAESGKLVAFICSDTLHQDFEVTVAQNLKTDTFVLHPQMNDAPSNEAFRSYRNACCNGYPRTTDLLTLNWAGGTTFVDNGEIHDFIVEPKSIWFRELRELPLDDAEIMHNHRLGLYFNRLGHSAAYLLSPDPHLFFFRTSKPFHRGPAVHARRYGPKMLRLSSWDLATSSWTPASADDQFDSTWNVPHPRVQALIRPFLPDRYLDAERLVQLSVGEAHETAWTGWERQPSYHLAGDETAQRLTLCRSNVGRGADFRNKCLSHFRYFAQIVSEPKKFSTRLVAFHRGEFTVNYLTRYTFQHWRNIYHKDEGVFATGIFAGHGPTAQRLDEIKKMALLALKDVNADKEKLAIWYHEPGTTEVLDFMDNFTPKLSDDPGLGPVAIDNADL